MFQFDINYNISTILCSDINIRMFIENNKNSKTKVKLQMKHFRLRVCLCNSNIEIDVRLIEFPTPFL